MAGGDAELAAPELSPCSQLWHTIKLRLLDLSRRLVKYVSHDEQYEALTDWETVQYELSKANMVTFYSMNFMLRT